MDVYEFAKQMELDGKAYYERLATETAFPGLKSIFGMLAADEQKHHDTILAMQQGRGGQMADTAVLETARNVFQELRESNTLAGGATRAWEGYRHAMKVEADSVRLYEDMAKKEQDADTVMLLLKIANEEKKHYNIMENLYELALKPEYFLAWREFSNLQEF
jgi:rubrerythrin